MDFPSGINVFVDGVHHNRYVQYVNMCTKKHAAEGKQTRSSEMVLTVTCMHYDVIIMPTLDTKYWLGVPSQ